MTEAELIERIEDTLYDMTEAEQMEVWNEYCDVNNYTDDKIYYNEPDELLYGQTPSDILRGVDMDEYRLDDTYAFFTIYGLRSSNYLDECQPFDLSVVIDYVINHEDALNNDDLQKVLDEYAESEDEDEE